MTSTSRPARRRSAGGRLRLRLAAVALCAGTALSGCGLGTAGGFSPTGTPAGPIADVPSLDGATFAVGSKDFTEQILLGKIMVILLQSAGASVTDYTNIPGSASSRQAQVEGQVDVSWEYTGTAWISYLGQTDPIPDEQAQFEAVRDLDAERYDLVWLEPAPMNNTYAFAATSARAAELGVEDLSDLVDVPPAERTFCVEAEFAARNDGFQPMLTTYGLTYGEDVTPDQVRTMGTGAIYAATAAGECTFGEVFTTDGRIKALDLAVLTDSENFFPKYNVSAVVGAERLQEYPQLRDLLGPVTQALDDDTLIELNARVDVDGQEPTDVANDWLREAGFITD